MFCRLPSCLMRHSTIASTCCVPYSVACVIKSWPTVFLFLCVCFFFFSSRRRHTRCLSDWSSDVCSSDLRTACLAVGEQFDRATAFQVDQESSVAHAPAQREVVNTQRSWGRADELRSLAGRSEERRVGKECRSRWSTYQ